MTRPVRLALFTDSLQPSGVGRVMETLAGRLPANRYRLFLICAADSGADELAARMEPLVAGTARLTVRSDDDLASLEQLVRQLRAWDVDLFHNHPGATWEGAWGTLAARCAGVRVVLATEHLPNVLQFPHELRHRRAMNRLLDGIVAVSESVRRSLVEAGLAPEAMIETVENGVESTAAPQRAAARRALELPSRAPVVLFLGRLVEQKEPASLLRAVRHLAEGGLPVIALVAGDGPLRGPLEATAADLGIRERVRFLGPRRDVPRLLAAADALAMPSRFEGLPLAALEAMDAGLPVVGSDAPGVRDAVEHGVNGWLAPPGDSLGLARGLRLAVAAEPGRRWGQAAREKCARRFSAARMARGYDRVYQRALGLPL